MDLETKILWKENIFSIILKTCYDCSYFTVISVQWDCQSWLLLPTISWGLDGTLISFCSFLTSTQFISCKTKVPCIFLGEIKLSSLKAKTPICKQQISSRQYFVYRKKQEKPVQVFDRKINTSIMTRLQQRRCLCFTHTYITLLNQWQAKLLFTKKNYLVFNNCGAHAERTHVYAEFSPPWPLFQESWGI